MQNGSNDRVFSIVVVGLGVFSVGLLMAALLIE